MGNDLKVENKFLYVGESPNRKTKQWLMHEGFNIPALNQELYFMHLKSVDRSKVSSEYHNWHLRDVTILVNKSLNPGGELVIDTGSHRISEEGPIERKGDIEEDTSEVKSELSPAASQDSRVYDVNLDAENGIITFRAKTQGWHMVYLKFRAFSARGVEIKEIIKTILKLGLKIHGILA
jgi:hypothetical protein